MKTSKMRRLMVLHGIVNSTALRRPVHCNGCELCTVGGKVCVSPSVSEYINSLKLFLTIMKTVNRYAMLQFLRQYENVTKRFGSMFIPWFEWVVSLVLSPLYFFIQYILNCNIPRNLNLF